MGILHKDAVISLLKSYFSLITDKEKYCCTDKSLYYIRQYELENLILKSFGLPDKIKYRLLIFEYAERLERNELKVEKLYCKLSAKAEEYLSGKTKTVRQLLLSARLHKQDPFDVLPELLVNTNSYTLFIYNEILLRAVDSEESVLEEFKKIKILNCLTDIYLLCFEKNYNHHPTYSKLRNSGLKYLSPYLKWYHRERKS